MSCRTIAGTAAGGVSYHYENVDAASSVTFVLTLPNYRRRRHGRRELLLCYRERCFERLALYRTIAGAAAMRLVTFVQRTPIGAECAMELSQAPPWVA